MAKIKTLKTDRIGRRSRFVRQPTGKKISLTDRDIQIFQLLYRYRYLRSDRLLNWFAPCSENRLKERLGDLYHEGFYINRPDAQWNHANSGLMPISYELTKNGLNALLEYRDHLTLPEPAVSHAGLRPQEIRQFDHALAITHAVFDLEMTFKDKPHQRLIFEHEILSRASNKIGKEIRQTRLPVTLPCSSYMPQQRKPYATWAIPDALFAVETFENEQPLYRFYILEVELKSPLIRRTPKKSSTLKKLLTYQQVLQDDIARKHLSLPNLYIIFDTNSLEKLKAIQTLASEIWSEEQHSRLLFKPIDGDEDSPMEITEKWHQHFQS